MKKTEIGKILITRLGCFANLEITENYILSWFSHFQNMEANIFDAALHEAVISNDSNFPPSPAKVYEVYNRLTAPAEALETADQAWASLWTDYKSASKKAKEAARLLEWENKGMWLESSLPFKKRDFAQIFNDLTDSDKTLRLQNKNRDLIGYSREKLNLNETKLLKEINDKVNQR